jgi:hypothetical protein
MYVASHRQNLKYGFIFFIGCGHVFCACIFVLDILNAITALNTRELKAS